MILSYIFSPKQVLRRPSANILETFSRDMSQKIHVNWGGKKPQVSPDFAQTATH